MALSEEQKLQLMEQALREGYDGYMSDLWAQSDPEEAMMQQQAELEVPTSDSINMSPGLPSGASGSVERRALDLGENDVPGFQSLVQSYGSAPPEEQPKGEQVQHTLDNPEFYRAGGYKLRDMIDLKLDFKGLDPKAHIDNYTKNYKYKKLGGIAQSRDTFESDYPDEHKPLSFAEYYYNSPKHQERMINSGYDEKQIEDRSSFLNDEGPTIHDHTQEKDIPYSFATPSENEVHMNPQTDSYENVLSHELSHLSVKFDGLNKKDIKEIADRHKVVKNGGNFAGDEHEKTYALEIKADLDSLRYMLYEAGIYDAGTEDFTFYDMTKAKELLGDSGIFKRLLEAYDDNELMWLMNNVAMGDPTETEDDVMYARKGGFSEKGYKKDSPHKNRSFNIIQGTKKGTPITMKNVKDKLLAFDNLGNGGILKPGKDYFFKGSSVVETPIKKRKGGEKDGPKLPKLNWGFLSHPKDGTIVVQKPLVRKKKKKTGGLWANIHAKRKRIASGSGEKMRKPGSKGAPTNRALKRSQN